MFSFKIINMKSDIFISLLELSELIIFG